MRLILSQKTLLFVLWFAACSDGISCTAVSDSQASSSENAPIICDVVGLISCDFPPFEDLATGACPNLRQHLVGRKVSDEVIQRVDDCEAPVFSAPSEFGSAAAVAARLEVDGPPSHGAFLFVHFTKGWRLVNQLLDPAWTHGGHCNTRFQLRWEGKDSKSEAILDVLSERICHISLDQKEISAGASDIATSECRHARYGLANNKLTKLSGVESDGPCQIR